MAVRDTWRRALEYFGLVEGDYIEEGEYEEGDTGSEMALDETAVAPREPVRSLPSRRRGRDGLLAGLVLPVAHDLALTDVVDAEERLLGLHAAGLAAAGPAKDDDDG